MEDNKPTPNGAAVEIKAVPKKTSKRVPDLIASGRLPEIILGNPIRPKRRLESPESASENRKRQRCLKKMMTLSDADFRAAFGFDEESPDCNTCESAKTKYLLSAVSRRCSTTSCCRTTNLCSSSSKSFEKQTSSKYTDMKNKAREMQSYCEQLNSKMKELVKTNVELATLLLNLLESVDIPGSPKLVGSALHLGEGETKKAVLDRINLLLERAGIANFPGAMGEILYNDLFRELKYQRESS